MFAGTAAVELLSVNIVYKATNMWNMWTRDGPQDAWYNRSKSGWFDNYCFKNWFRTVIRTWALRKERQAVVIGDNFLTHFDTDILKLCEDHEISFACLIPNSTHISQLLDAALYGPLRKKWKKILKDCKLKNYTQITLPKDIFPALLKQLVSTFDTDNLKGGFRSCGIYPFNPDALYSKLPECRFCSRKQAQYIKFSFKFKFETSQAKHKVHGSGSRKKCLSRRCSWTFAIKEQWKNGWVFAVGEWWNQFFWNGIWELSTWRFLTGSRYQECGLCSRGG